MKKSEYNHVGTNKQYDEIEEQLRICTYSEKEVNTDISGQ